MDVDVTTADESKVMFTHHRQTWVTMDPEQKVLLPLCLSFLMWSWLTNVVWLAWLLCVLVIALSYGVKKRSSAEGDLGKAHGGERISEGQFQSVADFCFIGTLVTLIMINTEVDRPMEAFILTLRWSPLLFSPLLICRLWGGMPRVALRVLFLPFRYRRLGMVRLGDMQMDPLWLSAWLCLLASSTAMGEYQFYYYPLVCFWLIIVHLMWGDRSWSWWLRGLLLLIVAGLGLGLHLALSESRAYLMRQGAQWLSSGSGQQAIMSQSTMMGQTASLQKDSQIYLRYRPNDAEASMPQYFKKAHFDQWLGGDTWFCSELITEIQADDEGWWSRRRDTVLGDSNEVSPDMLMEDRDKNGGTLWLLAHGKNWLPLPKVVTGIRSGACERQERVGFDSLRVYSELDWLEFELRTRAFSATETGPQDERYLGVPEADVAALETFISEHQLRASDLPSFVDTERRSRSFVEAERQPRSFVATEARSPESVATESTSPSPFATERHWRPEELKALLKKLKKAFKEHRYTLDLEASEGTLSPLDDFLNHRRRGHCEYFASASVLLLRHLGVSARYCTGFVLKGAVGDWWVARGEDAHAWCEAWDGQRWITVEMTPRVGVEARSMFHTLIWRPWSDTWNRLMFWMDQWRFRGGEDRMLTYAPVLLALVLLYFGFRLWVEWRKNRLQTKGSEPLKPSEKPDPGFARFEKAMAKNKMPRLPQESYGEWAKRLDRLGLQHPIDLELVSTWNRWAWSTFSEADLEAWRSVLREHAAWRSVKSGARKEI